MRERRIQPVRLGELHHMVRNLLLALGLVAGLSAWLAQGAADAADPAI